METIAMQGHNRPPADMVGDLQDKYKDLLDRMAELADAAKQAPETIADDITHAKVIELAKAMRKAEREADDRRRDEIEPFKAAGETVNGFFKSRIDPLEKLRRVITERHEAYAQRKAAAEKRRLEEEAEKRRRAEQEALAAAQEAQRTRLNAEAAQRECEMLADFARDSRNAAASKVQLAAADLADAKLAEAQINARLLAIDADFARRRQEKQEATLEERSEARRADAEALVAAKAKRQEADTRLRLAREEEAEERRKQIEAERQAAEQRRLAAAAGREERQQMDAAVREDRRAAKIEDKAGGPEADLARTRSEHGAVGTLARRWVSRVTDRTALDKAALWPFINGEAIEAALWKWMMAQTPEKRVMAGAVMTEETEGVVR